MSSLRAYIDQLPLKDREDFASQCGTTWAHLRNCMYGMRVPSAALAMAIERESGGKVLRETLRRDDAHLIWPDEILRDSSGIMQRIAREKPGVAQPDCGDVARMPSSCARTHPSSHP